MFKLAPSDGTTNLIAPQHFIQTGGLSHTSPLWQQTHLLSLKEQVGMLFFNSVLTAHSMIIINRANLLYTTTHISW